MMRKNKVFTRGAATKTAVSLTRRQLLKGMGAAAAASSFGAVGLASANPNDLLASRGFQTALPAPAPIPGGIDAPPIGFIHWFLPGPTDAATPFIGIPGFGLDVEPSTLTNFDGYTAFAVVAGQAEGSDGQTYNLEFDVRVMAGDYIAADGSRQHGTFGFF